MSTQTSPTPDQRAAHALLTDLRTRVATQRLPYQHGTEERALKSLHEIFEQARKAMRDNPGCDGFARVATRMLNVDLRPVTAKWHRAHESGVLASKDGATAFRVDLARVQDRLRVVSLVLQRMAYDTEVSDDDAPPPMGPDDLEECLGPVRFGIAPGNGIDRKTAADINDAEAADVGHRRGKHGIDTPDREDAIGLALSGGGIRSATFCLGVVQVLAQKRLMGDVDYLSTVSGGGYAGAFVSAVVGSEGRFEDVGMPHGPDTASVRHLRRNAKYLSAVDLRQRWIMVTCTVAGLLLNLTAPLSVLASVAWVGALFSYGMDEGVWTTVAKALGGASALTLAAYGILLRFGKGDRVTGRILAAMVGVDALACAAFLADRAYRAFAAALDVKWSTPAPVALALLGLPAVAWFLPAFRTPAARRTALRIALALGGTSVPIMVVIVCFALGAQIPKVANGAANADDGTSTLATIALVSGIYALLFLDLNRTGPHRLYRDRLARTFVHRPRSPTESDQVGDRDQDAKRGAPKNGAQGSKEGAKFSLGTLNPSGIAPYHLINATVNLPSSTSDVLRERRGDFFVLSKHWCGSPSTGYKATDTWKGSDGQFDLATAMAISGAAASPHMGLETRPGLSALMTLLNLRLGYWVRNPGRRALGAPAFGCLMREMTGALMSEKRAWLNLSDGGHIENMGVYELLRRRCKYIVSVDGEADPDSTFGGHLTLVRHAQIDLGIQMQPRLDELRPEERSRLSRSHFQLFRIQYPATNDGRPEGTGLMLYIKLSLTGDEAELLRRYRKTHPDFPHQSTLDQFYDEEQFESYRQLGVHVAEGTFSPALMTQAAAPRNVRSWFAQLAANMLEPL